MGSSASKLSCTSDRTDQISNISGKQLFQDKRIYKIGNMKDKQGYLTVKEDGTVILDKWRNASNQKFKVIKLSDKEFRISSLKRHSSHALDFSNESCLLSETVCSDSTNQVWYSEEQHENSNICLIKSKEGRCLKSQGMSKAVLVTSVQGPSALCFWQLWEIEATDSD